MIRPPQTDLRRAEAFAWGSRQQQPLTAIATATIVARNYKAIHKGSLIGSADLFVTKWRLTIYGVMWFRKGEKEWTSFSSKEWTDATGAKKYFPFAKFESHGDQSRFAEMAIEAIRRIAGDQP